MRSVVRKPQPPEEIRSLDAVARADYVDVFSVRASDPAASAPEDWARAAIEDTAGLGGQFVWRVLLGLRLEGHGSPDRIGGWTIAERGEKWIRLEAASWCLTAHVVVHVDDAEVTVATCVHYDRTIASLIWRPLSAVHRAAMPGLLRGTARRVRAFATR